MGGLGTAGAVAVLALVPAAFRWWSSRTLSADDPALPERLLAHYARTAQVAAVAVTSMALIGGRHALWGVPTALLAGLSVAYPTRRRVLGETWSFSAYFTWTVRGVLAIWGFWMLLAATPAIVAATSQPWLAAAAAFLLLQAWSYWYSELLLALVGARPFAETAWPEGFSRVLARSHASRPLVWRAGPPGARVANALALPGLRQPHVLFSDPLLEVLTDEEATAVLAHEVSHLELFTPELLRRWRLRLQLMIGAAVIVGPVVHFLAPPYWFLGMVTWPVTVVLLMGSRGRVVRDQETPSDLRAVALCGDADAVVSGLVKLHMTARMPRRWAATFEDRSSHPSLARRIRAIRQAEGTPPSEAAAPPFLVRSPDRAAAVVLDADRVRFLSGVPSEGADPGELLASAQRAASVLYADVRELRVAATRTGLPAIIAVNTEGTRWRMPIAPADVGAVQAALDALDARLPEPPAARADVRPGIRLYALVVAALAVLASSFGAVWVAALTVVLPSPAGLLAAGLSAAAAGLIGAGTTERLDVRVLCLLLTVTGGVAGWRAYRWRTLDGSRDWIAGMAIAATALLFWAAIALSAEGQLAAVHEAVRQLPSAVVLPLGLAALWAWSRIPRERLLATGAVLLAGVGLFAMTPTFVDTVVRDPLITRHELPAARAGLRPVRSQAVSTEVTTVRFAPSGRVYAIAERGGEDEEYATAVFEIRSFDGGAPPVRVEAMDIVLLDDRTIALLERSGAGVAIVRRALPDLARATWQLWLPAGDVLGFGVDPETRAWQVVAAPERSDLPARFEGVVGSDVLRRHERPAGDARDYTWFAIGGTGPPIGWSSDYSTYRPAIQPWLALLSLQTRYPITLTPAGPATAAIRSAFPGTCHDAPPGHPVLCVARDGSRSHVWSWRSGPSLTPIGWLAGDFVPLGGASGGWLFGWQHGRFVAVDAENRRTWAVSRSPGQDVLDAPQRVGSLVGGLIHAGTGTRVGTFALAPMP